MYSAIVNTTYDAPFSPCELIETELFWELLDNSGLAYTTKEALGRTIVTIFGYEALVTLVVKENYKTQHIG